MALSNPFNYKNESRYNYYYKRLQIFYQKPITQVSSAVLFSILMILFFAVFAIRPTLITIAELLQKIEDQKIVLEKAEKKVSSLATAQQLYDQISESLPTLNQAIPPDYQIQTLLLSLEATAANLDIPISNLSLSKVSYPIKQTNSNSLQEMKFVLNFETNYPAAKTLISNFDQLPRMITIDSITFNRDEINSRNIDDSSVKIKVNLNCRVFYYPEKIQ